MALNENTITKEISLNGISAKSVHARNTIVIELEGPNVHQITQEIMSKIVQLKVGIARDEIRALYNLGNHSIWYLSLTRHAAINFHELLHNMTFKSRDYNVAVTLKHLDRSKTRAFLEWVPPTFTDTDVRMIVQTIANPQTRIEIKKLKICKWEIIFHPENIKNIPHYINVSFSTHSHLTLQLRIPGRETPCFFCSSYQHETCMCPTTLDDDESHTCASKCKIPDSVNLRRNKDTTNEPEQGQILEKVSAFFSLCDPYTADSSGSEVELFSQLRLSPKNEKPGVFTPSYTRNSSTGAAKYKQLEVGKTRSSCSSSFSSPSPTPSDKSLNLYPEKRYVSTSSMNSQKEVSFDPSSKFKAISLPL